MKSKSFSGTREMVDQEFCTWLEGKINVDIKFLSSSTCSNAHVITLTVVVVY